MCLRARPPSLDRAIHDHPYITPLGGAFPDPLPLRPLGCTFTPLRAFPHTSLFHPTCQSEPAFGGCRHLQLVSKANTLFNVQKSNGGDNIINWDIIVMMEPSTIAGAVIGSFASKFLPDFVLTVSLAIALSLLSVRAIQKGLAMLHKDSRCSLLAYSNGSEAHDTIPPT